MSQSPTTSLSPTADTSGLGGLHSIENELLTAERQGLN